MRCEGRGHGWRAPGKGCVEVGTRVCRGGWGTGGRARTGTNTQEQAARHALSDDGARTAKGLAAIRFSESGRRYGWEQQECNAPNSQAQSAQSPRRSWSPAKTGERHRCEATMKQRWECGCVLEGGGAAAHPKRCHPHAPLVPRPPVTRSPITSPSHPSRPINAKTLSTLSTLSPPAPFVPPAAARQ